MLYLLLLTFLALSLLQGSLFFIVCALVFYTAIAASWVWSCSVSVSLSCLLLISIYVGAIIVVVGYVCAVSPNVSLSQVSWFSASEHSYLSFVQFLFFVSVVLALGLSITLGTGFSIEESAGALFLFSCLPGISSLFLVIVSLLLVLLISTSSYFISLNAGPLRGVGF